MGADPTVSIALCTYQGARFLPEQLVSLLSQTTPPDEVVVCDDGSTDGTVELLHRFREEAHFPVHVHTNERRLGSTANFSRAMQRCTGDVIMLCDQDDIWYPAKIQRLLTPFRQAHAPALAFSDADLIDEDSRTDGVGLWEALGFAPSLQHRFGRGESMEVLCIGNVVTGATSALDSRYRALVLPIPAGWVHDAWLALIVACVAEVRMVDAPLVRYRLHTAQQIGVPTALTRLYHLRRRSQFVRRMKKRERPVLLERAEAHRVALARVHERRATFPPRPNAMAYLEGKASHFELRGRVHTVRPATRRATMVAREARARRYHRFSNGWTSVVKDLLLLDETLNSASRR